MSGCLAGACNYGVVFAHAVTMHPAVVVVLDGLRLFWMLHYWLGMNGMTFLVDAWVVHSTDCCYWAW